MELIGRKREKKILSSFLETNESGFLAVYGRRRVGKTFLIREFFRGKGVFFEVVGLKDGALKEQLANFLKSINETFRPSLPIRSPATWNEAFEILTTLLDSQPESTKKLIFLDELPWLASSIVPTTALDGIPNPTQLLSRSTGSSIFG